MNPIMSQDVLCYLLELMNPMVSQDVLCYLLELVNPIMSQDVLLEDPHDVGGVGEGCSLVDKKLSESGYRLENFDILVTKYQR